MYFIWAWVNGLIFVRLAEASDSTPSNSTLHEDRLHQSEEPGPKLLRLLRGSYQWCKKTGTQSDIKVEFVLCL